MPRSKNGYNYSTSFAQYQKSLFSLYNSSEKQFKFQFYHFQKTSDCPKWNKGKIHLIYVHEGDPNC